MTEAPDPPRYRDAVLYQPHNKRYFHANNAVVGDFPGLLHNPHYIPHLAVGPPRPLPPPPAPSPRAATMSRRMTSSSASE